MRVVKGRPISEADYAGVQKQLVGIFYKLLFQPLVELLAPHNAQVKAAARELKNSSSSNREMRNESTAPVINGIRSGKIQYADGVFSGDFNASISSALRSYGATFNRVTGTFSLAPQNMPMGVLAAVNEYADVAEQLHDELMKKIDEIGRNLTYAVGEDQYRVDPDGMIKKTEKEFNKHFGDVIGRSELSERAKKELAEDYTNNLAPSIVKFGNEMVHELRQIVASNSERGYRFDSLVDLIQGRYEVAKSRATLIARTETSTFVSDHREQRFKDVGITQYRWRTAGDAEVRADHKKLDGQIFEFANPPIADERTGTRANAGCIWNCRCIADPLLPADMERELEEALG